MNLYLNNQTDLILNEAREIALDSGKPITPGQYHALISGRLEPKVALQQDWNHYQASALFGNFTIEEAQYSWQHQLQLLAYQTNKFSTDELFSKEVTKNITNSEFGYSRLELLNSPHISKEFALQFEGTWDQVNALSTGKVTWEDIKDEKEIDPNKLTILEHSRVGWYEIKDEEIDFYKADLVKNGKADWYQVKYLTELTWQQYQIVMMDKLPLHIATQIDFSSTDVDAVRCGLTFKEVFTSSLSSEQVEAICYENGIDNYNYLSYIIEERNIPEDQAELFTQGVREHSLRYIGAELYALGKVTLEQAKHDFTYLQERLIKETTIDPQKIINTEMSDAQIYAVLHGVVDFDHATKFQAPEAFFGMEALLTGKVSLEEANKFHWHEQVECLEKPDTTAENYAERCLGEYAEENTEL